MAEHNEDVAVVDWPKCFGDIMPLETVWMKIAHEFDVQNITARSEDALWNQISLMWNNTCTEDFCNQLIKNIPVKLQKVVDCDGAKYVE